MKNFMAQKNNKCFDVDVDHIVISKLIGTRNNSKYLVEYLDDVVRPLILILRKMN